MVVIDTQLRFGSRSTRVVLRLVRSWRNEGKLHWRRFDSDREII